jgi:hypothetical protein
MDIGLALDHIDIRARGDRLLGDPMRSTPSGVCCGLLRRPGDQDGMRTPQVATEVEIGRAATLFADFEAKIQGAGATSLPITYVARE